MTYLIISTKFQKYRLLVLGTYEVLWWNAGTWGRPPASAEVRKRSCTSIPPYTLIACTGMTLPSYPEWLLIFGYESICVYAAMYLFLVVSSFRETFTLFSLCDVFMIGLKFLKLTAHSFITLPWLGEFAKCCI